MQHDAGVGGDAALFVGIGIAATTGTARWLVAGGRATRPQTAEGFAAVCGRVAGGPDAGTIVVMEVTDPIGWLWPPLWSRRAAR